MKHLYTARFAVVNIVAFALLIWAAFQGWLGMIVEADQSRMSLVIAGVFLYGLVLCGVKIHLVRCWPDRIAAKTHENNESLKVRYQSYITGVRHIANNLVLLGLIGTVIGFVIAFGAIDAEAIGDVDMAADMVAQIIDGMSVALYTTLVGSIAHVWLYSCFKILEQAATAAWLGDPC